MKSDSEALLSSLAETVCLAGNAHQCPCDENIRQLTVQPALGFGVGEVADHAIQFRCGPDAELLPDRVLAAEMNRRPRRPDCGIDVSRDCSAQVPAAVSCDVNRQAGSRRHLFPKRLRPGSSNRNQPTRPSAAASMIESSVVAVASPQIASTSSGSIDDFPFT